MDISFEILPNDRKYYGTRILATAPNGDKFAFSVWPPYSFGSDKAAGSVAISPRENPESFDASHGETWEAYRIARLLEASPTMLSLLKEVVVYNLPPELSDRLVDFLADMEQLDD